ncbi:MAG: DNA polymerase III subunit delta' [Cellulosilyticaceae bacterium]
MGFEDIIGHEEIKKYFNKALHTEHIAHSYIFEGIEGVGKLMFAKALTKKLLCEADKTERPCGKCSACILNDAGNHPDVTIIEKDTKVIKIDTIRERVVSNMEIKPLGRYKVIIINGAEVMNVAAQNAMLKTIEEPPSYGIIIVITENNGALLPTILSRCVTIPFNPLSREVMHKYLDNKNLMYNEKEVYTQFSEGSIGIANQLISDESFMEDRRNSIEYLVSLEKADLIELYDLVKTICGNKDKMVEMLNFWELWYRDIAILKSTKSDKLYYLDYHSTLLDSSSKLTYNKISTNLDAIKEAKKQISQNAYGMFIIENLLLKLKERKK